MPDSQIFLTCSVSAALFFSPGKCRIRLETSERKNSCLESTVEAFSQGILPASPPISQRWEVRSFEKVSLLFRGSQSDFVFPFLGSPIYLPLSPPSAAEAAKVVGAYPYGKRQTCWLKARSQHLCFLSGSIRADHLQDYF